MLQIKKMDNISVVPTHKPHYLSLVITFKAKQSNFSMHLPLKVSVNLGDVICKSSRSFLLWWSSNTHTSKVNLSKVTLFQENILTAFSNNHLPMQKKKKFSMYSSNSCWSFQHLTQTSTHTMPHGRKLCNLCRESIFWLHSDETVILEKHCRF